MKHKTTWGMAVLGIALVMALAWAFAPRPLEVELAPVTQGRFETTIDEDAKTRLADRYTVSAPLAGRLARITLREGDAVAADAVVATLTPVLPAMLDERTRQELRARVDSAGDNLQRAGTRVERAKVGLAQARNDAQRSEQLAQQGFIAPTRLETERLATSAALREVEVAAADQRIAAHDLEQARAALGALRAAPGATAPTAFPVRAPVAGRVLRVLQPSEATVAAGTALVELGDIGQLEIVAELLTTDALAARPGSPVKIERWGGPTTLEGRVRSVEPAAYTKVSALGVEEQRVKVLIDILSPPAAWLALGDGYRVSVRIVTLADEHAVQVPVSAVFPLPAEAVRDDAADVGANGAGPNGTPAPAARHAVFVVDAGRARLVPVAMVARNGSTAWLRSGVAPGRSVIVYPPAAVHDGVRVAARKVTP